MNWWKALIGLFLAIGVGVAILSVYRASVDGLMKKVGLVGSDFDAAIVSEKLTGAVNNIKGTVACDLPTRIRGAVTFMLASDQEQAQLAFQLGSSRIKCGAQILAQGNAEVGTYEVLKGMNYLKQGYQFVKERMEVDSRVCEGLPEGDLTTTVNSILDATNGRVYELIWSDWQKVSEMRTAVDPYCVDQRVNRR